MLSQTVLGIDRAVLLHTALFGIAVARGVLLFPTSYRL
jgi:hypothetical protein